MMKKLVAFTCLCLSILALQAQWTSTGAPALVRGTSEILTWNGYLVALANCSPLYSADWGATWHFIQTNQDLQNSTRHFEFQGEAYFSAAYQFWKVIDNSGVLTIGVPQTYPQSVADVVADASGIYAAAMEQGLLVGLSPGNFTLHNSGLPVHTVPWDTVPHHDTYAVATNNQTVFVGTNAGVYRASKGVYAFASANNGLPLGTVRNLICKDSLLLANVDSSLYRSTDAGNSWTQASIPYHGFYNRLQVFGDTLYACSTYGGVYRSIDSGLNWTLASPTLQYGEVTLLAQGGNDIFASTWQALYRGLDPATPLPLNGCGSVIYSMATTDNCIAAADGRTVYVTTDLGLSWDAVPNPDAFEPAYMLVSLEDRLLWAARFALLNDTVPFLLSEDCAATWDTTVLPCNYMFTFLSSDGHHGVANLDDDGYWYISDSGSTFTPIAAPTVSACQSPPVLIVVGDAIYATSCDNTELLRTQDMGQTWIECGNGLPSDRVCYLERVGGRLFATFADDIYQAVSGDSIWAPAKFGIPSQSGAFFDLEWDGQQYYVCNGRKVWASLDGFHWVDVSAGLPMLPHTNYTYSGMALKDGVLFMGTHGRGIWKRPISEISAGVIDPMIAKSLNLYPNPATERVFWTAEQDLHHIACYNLLGQPVDAPLVGQSLDVSRLPAGVYVVRATLDSGELLQGRILVER